MNDLHRDSAYQQIYNRFWDEFVESYSRFRKSQMNPMESLIEAKETTKEYLKIELCKNFKNLSEVLLVYNHVKYDFLLIEKAIQIYYTDDFS